jgi:hypothetical protein
MCSAKPCLRPPLTQHLQLKRRAFLSRRPESIDTIVAKCRLVIPGLAGHYHDVFNCIFVTLIAPGDEHLE